MLKKIVFRCDGAALPEVGTGHIVRDIEIANALVAKGLCSAGEISFVARVEGPFFVGCRLIKEAGFRIEAVKDDSLNWNSDEESRALINIAPTILIIDRLSTDFEWMASLVKNICSVVAIDDVGGGALLANVLINGILHDIPSARYRYVGYDYLFLKNADFPKKIKVPKESCRIVASFGGYDHRDLMGFFLDTLLEDDMLEKNLGSIELLVGPEDNKTIDRWKGKSKKISLKYAIEVDLVINAPDFLARVSEADIAVLSGGLTIFDAVSLGVPSLGLPQYEHQLNTLHTLQVSNAVRIGSKGMVLDQVFFSQSFARMILSQEERTLLKNVGPSVIDRKGSLRIVDIFSALLK